MLSFGAFEENDSATALKGRAVKGGRRFMRTPAQLRFPGATCTWSDVCSHAVTEAYPFTLTKN